MISVVIPLYNEADNLAQLYHRVASVLRRLNQSWEIILVNDGSTDRSRDKLDSLALADPAVKVIHLRRNFGQTAAMMAGVDHAAGHVIVPMDGDLQNDPVDIPRLLEKLDEGYDVVSGWRKDRKDNPLRRNLPSRVANRLISLISGVPLHDYGCSLKAYRKEVIKGVKLYGEMHRFIPIYASWFGAKIAEIPVDSPRPRARRIEVRPQPHPQGAARSDRREVSLQVRREADVRLRKRGGRRPGDQSAVAGSGPCTSSSLKEHPSSRRRCRCWW